MLWDGVPEPRRQGKPGQVNYFCERSYQTKARQAIEEGFKNHNSVLVELATGLGKTEIFTQIAKDWSEGRCLVIAPYIQLIGQAAKKIYLRTGEQPGIEQGRNWSVETPWGRSKYVVASKDSLMSGDPPRYERIRDVGLVVVDEAHLSITPKWKELLDYYRADGAKVLGVTATAKRHDQRAMLNCYDECVFQYGIKDAVDQGWLAPAVTHCVQLESLDLSGVETSNTVHGKDFRQTQLNALLEKSETIMEIADITAKETKNEKTVVYCSSVEEAKLVAERLVDNYGIKADWIASDPRRCSPSHREETMRSFQEDSGGVTHVCNVGILTTGWDYPDLRNIVMARPTRSRSLYTQIFGRGTRPLAGVVDFDGSSPESRREAIANSSKPTFRMIDLVDSSLAHKIVTSADVMSGDLGFEVVERAKENILDAPGAVELDQAMLEAEEQIRTEREKEERERRKIIEANAKYHTLNVNPFGKNAQGSVVKKKRGAYMTFGKFRGTHVTDVPDWYLKSCMQGKPFIAQAWLRNSIQKEVKRREI